MDILLLLSLVVVVVRFTEFGVSFKVGDFIISDPSPTGSRVDRREYHRKRPR